jgi:hypothetical protein
METGRRPVIFVPHGGGPWPFTDAGASCPRAAVQFG